MNKLTALALTGIALAGAAPAADAAITLFDDANGTGWTRPWFTPAQTSNVRTGTTATGTGNGQLAFDHAGLGVGGDHILEMWLNTSTATAATRLFVQISYTEPGGVQQNNRPLDARNVPVTYEFAGQTFPFSATAVATDTDTTTWQLLRVDLSQTSYTGFPFVAHKFDPATDLLRNVTLRSEGGQSANLLADDVRLVAVPEPASLALLAAGALLACGRSRR